MSNVLEYFGIFIVAFLFGICIGRQWAWKEVVSNKSACSSTQKEQVLNEIPANLAYRAVKILCEEDN